MQTVVASKSFFPVVILRGVSVAGETVGEPQTERMCWEVQDGVVELERRSWSCDTNLNAHREQTTFRPVAPEQSARAMRSAIDGGGVEPARAAEKRWYAAAPTTIPTPMMRMSQEMAKPSVERRLCISWAGSAGRTA
jgi:hypothetical protein